MRETERIERTRTMVHQGESDDLMAALTAQQESQLFEHDHVSELSNPIPNPSSVARLHSVGASETQTTKAAWPGSVRRKPIGRLEP